MYNLPEMTANDLIATVPETNDPYVILQSDKQPYTVKIKLSEFKKWMIDDLKDKLNSVSRTTRSLSSRHMILGPGSRIGGFNYNE